jgi:hypothetical protein
VKKFLSILGLAVLLLMAFVSCASPPPPPPQEEEPIQASNPYRVIEHKNTMLGGTVPDWATMAIGALEADPRFTDNYVFKFEEVGQDLTGVKLLADRMNAPAAIAQQINARVQSKFAGAQVGDNNFVETYFENTVKTISEATISGFRKYDDFWVHREVIETGEREYIYYSLFIIPVQEVDRLIQEAITGQAAVTEEETTARERVREIFAEGL